MRLTPSLATVTFTTKGLSPAAWSARQMRISSSRSPGPIGRVSVVMYGETGTGGTPGQAREGDAAAALATATGTSADSHARAVLSSGARREVTAGTEAAIRTRSSRGSS